MKVKVILLENWVQVKALGTIIATSHSQCTHANTRLINESCANIICPYIISIYSKTQPITLYNFRHPKLGSAIIIPECFTHGLNNKNEVSSAILLFLKSIILSLSSPSQSKSNSVSDNCRSFFSRSCQYFELSLLLHRGFIIYSLAVTCFNAGYFIPYVHLVAHSRLVGFSEFQAAFVISSTGVTDILGRVVSGWASDLRHLRSLHLLTIWTALVGLFLLLLPLCSLQGHYAGLLTVSLAYGFCAGAMTPLVFSVVPEIVGMDRMVGALGLLQLIESVGGLLGAPLSGKQPFFYA